MLKIKNISKFKSNIYRILIQLDKMNIDRNHCTFVMFEQLWCSTALGFDGVGGSALTMAITTVVEYTNDAHIFFDCKYAYSIHNYKYNNAFIVDMTNEDVESVKLSTTRYGTSVYFADK